MNRLQGEVLRAVVFRSFDGTRSLSEADEHATLSWLARKGYIVEARWDAEVTYGGYLAGIREEILTPWYRLAVDGDGGIRMELNTYGRGSQNATYDARQAFDTALRTGFASGQLKLVERERSGNYQVVAR